MENKTTEKHLMNIDMSKLTPEYVQKFTQDLYSKVCKLEIALSHIQQIINETKLIIND